MGVFVMMTITIKDANMMKEIAVHPIMLCGICIVMIVNVNNPSLHQQLLQHQLQEAAVCQLLLVTAFVMIITTMQDVILMMEIVVNLMKMHFGMGIVKSVYVKMIPLPLHARMIHLQSIVRK